eukprot:CAMPEP_0183712662 /NCGR_PEP_ID=MMETSP0737-20130205/7738_1 /TAXON_ID=385413 /ORGANISM="Thalassiosira miniscula, Strain CCMP1093" /LENGTH=297 /DNA_ID=CAMNT_0025941321 /DNA_START=283 /DNA_END=1172 /DNA_ORIENTATION=+
MKAHRQKTLKPILLTGQAVYSAFWLENDPDRLVEPDWYPGVITKVRTSRNPPKGSNHSSHSHTKKTAAGSSNRKDRKDKKDNNEPQPSQQHHYDEQFGSVRYYDVNFDDGDVISDVPEHYIMAAEEYLLNVKDDDDDEEEEDDVERRMEMEKKEQQSQKQPARGRRSGRNSGKHETPAVPVAPIAIDEYDVPPAGRRPTLDKNGRKRQWIGVKNVTDRTSSDLWAKHVGWYVADVDDHERTFSLLSDALRAYDASVVRKRMKEEEEEDKKVLVLEGGGNGGKVTRGGRRGRGGGGGG